MDSVYHTRYTALVYILILLTPGALACYRSPGDAAVTKMKVRDRWIVDGSGRVRLFHGFNAVRKSFPWYTDTLTDSDLQYYQDWGFNAVRLGAMWSGVNPAEGTTNMTYIKVIQDMVRRAGDHGIYVILDMHQDVISTRYHSYDGVPRWVIDKFPPSENPYPWPLPRLSQWADGYLTEAVGNAFQCLYENFANSRNYMAKFWQIVAENFKDFPNVLGYELINEPWAGNIYKNPGLLLPGNAGRINLAPLYDVLNAAIRQIDNHTLIFYEPVTWGMVFPGTGEQGNGFKSVPGGAAFADRSVMSWHYYCWILATDDKKPYGSFDRLICDRLLGPKVYATVLKDIKRTGGSSFLTEFGLCEPDSNRNETESIECDFVMSLADANFQSWTYWDSQFFTPDGRVRYDLVKYFARVYPTAIAGIPLVMNYNTTTQVFFLSYMVDTEIKEPTEIKVPKLPYPNGFSVKLSPGLRYEFNQSSRIISVWYVRAGNTLQTDIHVVVSILPKNIHK